MWKVHPLIQISKGRNNSYILTMEEPVYAIKVKLPFFICLITTASVLRSICFSQEFYEFGWYTIWNTQTTAISYLQLFNVFLRYENHNKLVGCIGTFIIREFVQFVDVALFFFGDHFRTLKRSRFIKRAKLFSNVRRILFLVRDNWWHHMRKRYTLVRG